MSGVPSEPKIVCQGSFALPLADRRCLDNFSPKPDAIWLVNSRGPDTRRGKRKIGEIRGEDK